MGAEVVEPGYVDVFHPLRYPFPQQGDLSGQ